MSTAIDQLNAAFDGRYQIERELGAGGMATVYLARDLKHDREVAIKVLRADLSAVLGAERFLAEVRITARLDHPHILTLIDSGEADGILYYVLPVVRGESLRARLQREKQLGIDDAIGLTKQVASALDYAHAQGVVHRDIKPENILIHQGEAVLTDFGIALAVREAGGNRLTETGLSLGTPQYMSPEQATGDRTLDARSDVYSLAAVLYEMLGGEPPVTGATAQAMIAKLLMEKPTSLRVVRDTVPEGVDRAVARGLAKVPADRFASAGEFVRAVDAGLTAPAPIASPANAAGPRRRSVLIVAIVVLLIAAVGAFAWRAFSNHTDPHAAISLGDRTQVTFNGHALYTAISDDGKSVAYSIEECAPAGCTYALEVQDVGSQTTRRLVTGSVHPVYNIRWSPDRRSILYVGDVAGENVVGLVSPLGGSPTRIASTSTNLDFFGADSLVLIDARSPQEAMVTGLDGIPRGRLPVLDPAEKGTVTDLISVPGSRWFIVGIADSASVGRFRVVDRSGRRVSETTVGGAGVFLFEWASADALWRLMRSIENQDRNVLLRYPFDSTSGRLSAVADTVYRGAAGYFDVTRDGKNVVLSEGSTTYESWAVDLGDLLRGRFPAERMILSSTTLGAAVISPDGQHVLVMRSLSPRFAGSVRPFAGGPGQPLSIPDALGVAWFDSVSLSLGALHRQRIVLELVDFRTGVARDSLLLPPDVLPDELLAAAAVTPNGWLWKTRAGPMMLQRRDDEPPRVIPMAKDVGLVSSFWTSANGRRVAITARMRSAPDSSEIIVEDVDGGSPAVWARVRGRVDWPIMGANGPTGFVQFPSIFALDGPNRVRLVGTVPVPGYVTVSSDFKRATLNREEYHGDAWLTKVIRR